MKRIDLVGHKFGRLLVTGFHGTIKQAAYWNCTCDCGNLVTVISGSLRYGLSKSCGCLLRDNLSGKTHGESKRTKEYQAWEGLKSRCYTKSDHRYKNYGAIGITVCERWKNSYENFLSDMGRAPSKDHSIDRIEVTGSYEKTNCRWATDSEQANNKTTTFWVEYDGRRMSLANWAREKGVNYKMLHKYMKTNNMTFESACEKLKPI